MVLKEAIVLELPFPPNVNHYWRSLVIKGKLRVLISKRGRQYREDVGTVVLLAGSPRLKGIVEVSILAYYPDRRRRDLDNLLKGPLDALKAAGVYEDDSLIHRLEIARMRVQKPGKLIIAIEPVEDNNG